jgi:hypothetical protein
VRYQQSFVTTETLLGRFQHRADHRPGHPGARRLSPRLRRTRQPHRRFAVRSHSHSRQPATNAWPMAPLRATASNMVPPSDSPPNKSATMIRPALARLEAVGATPALAPCGRAGESAAGRAIPESCTSGPPPLCGPSPVCPRCGGLDVRGDWTAWYPRYPDRRKGTHLGRPTVVSHRGPSTHAEQEPKGSPCIHAQSQLPAAGQRRPRAPTRESNGAHGPVTPPTRNGGHRVDGLKGIRLLGHR